MIKELSKAIALLIVVHDRTSRSEHAESVQEAIVKLKVLSNILRVLPYNRIHPNFKMMTKLMSLKLDKISIIKKLLINIKKKSKITKNRMTRSKLTKKISNFL